MTRPVRLDVDRLLADPTTHTLVCCGSGGVGKTTTAAALGLRAAEQGRRVCVLTIDPARRLAQSMGLQHLDNTPRAVPGIAGEGSLDAMMLDMKRTFDGMVEGHADPERAAQILANPFYQALSTSFAGTQEYMAMEKLSQLQAEADASGRWDLIVVDTPPSRSALDFLDAPKRLGSFLDGRFLRLMSAPAKTGGRGVLRAMSAGLGAVTGVLHKVLGADLLADVQTFVSALDTMFGGFRERAEQTYAALQAPGTGFLVVAAPEPDALREAAYFVERLEAERMPLTGLVLNRVTTSDVADLDAASAAAAAAQLRDSGRHPTTADLLQIHVDRMRTIERESALAARFTTVHPDVPVAVSPALPGDVHDLEGLRQVAAALADRSGSTISRELRGSGMSTRS
jgi:anion-transporting  ArsA/GET3 family ATPase